MDMQILIAAGIIAITLIVLIKWRAGARYGKIRPSQEVTEAYDCFSVEPNMIYYISGSDLYPNAIIGIDKAWTLESDLWKKKELNAQGMKELVQNMQSKTMELCLTLHGFVILDNSERKIGNWFSIMGIHTVVEIIGERRVVVYTPPLDTYLHS
ncbi:MAG: hypothetical protein ABFD82_05680 [Syntrophaceae bacterium]